MSKVTRAVILCTLILSQPLLAWLWVRDERRKSFRSGLSYCIDAHEGRGGIYYPLPGGTDGGRLKLDTNPTDAEVDSLLNLAEREGGKK